MKRRLYRCQEAAPARKEDMQTEYKIFEAYVDRGPAPERFHDLDIAKVDGRTYALVPEAWFERQQRRIMKPGGQEEVQERYVARTYWQTTER